MLFTMMDIVAGVVALVIVEITAIRSSRINSRRRTQSSSSSSLSVLHCVVFFRSKKLICFLYHELYFVSFLLLPVAIYRTVYRMHCTLCCKLQYIYYRRALVIFYQYYASFILVFGNILLQWLIFCRHCFSFFSSAIGPPTYCNLPASYSIAFDYK